MNYVNSFKQISYQTSPNLKAVPNKRYIRRLHCVRISNVGRLGNYKKFNKCSYSLNSRGNNCYYPNVCMGNYLNIR